MIIYSYSTTNIFGWLKYMLVSPIFFTFYRLYTAKNIVCWGLWNHVNEINMYTSLYKTKSIYLIAGVHLQALSLSVWMEVFLREFQCQWVEVVIAWSVYITTKLWFLEPIGLLALSNFLRPLSCVTIKVFIWNFNYRHSVIIFDPSDNSFTDGPSLIYERRGAACTLFNRQVL